MFLNVTNEAYLILMITLAVSIIFIILGMIGVFLIRDLKNLKRFIEKMDNDINFNEKITYKHYLAILNYGHMILINKSLRDKINDSEY